MDKQIKKLLLTGSILFLITGCATQIDEETLGGRTSNFWKTLGGKYQTITSKPVNITGDLEFQDEIKPDGELCSAGQILKKTGADNWSCATETGGGGAGGSGLWATSSATQMYNIGSYDVGINDSTPTYKLDVNGTFRVTGISTFDTAIKYQDWTISTSTVVCMAPEQCEYQCDGTADDVQINAAITAMNAAGGGTIFLKEEEFLIENSVVLKTNVILQGNGIGTIIKLENEATLAYAGIIRMKYTTRVVDAGIRNLTIDGNRANQSSLTNKYGVYAEGDNLFVENCYIKDTPSYGVDPHEATGGIASNNFRTINNVIDNCGSVADTAAAITYDYNYNGTIEGNYITNSPYHAISIVTNSKKITILNNKISTTTSGHGIQVSGGTDIVIKNNIIDLAGDNGIYLSGSNGTERVSIIGNKIINSVDLGIRIYKSSHNIISDNLLYHNSSSGGDDAIQLDDDGSVYSTYNIVSGNRIVGSNERYGIREDATGNDYNIITNNIVTGTQTGDISSQGVNSQLWGNLTEDGSYSTFLDGNLGIGTNAPAYTLDVYGNARVDGNLIVSGTGHDSFSDFVANEHLDWTGDLGAVNIHSGNYTDNNTTYTSSDFTHDDLTGFVANEHINWTADQGATNIHAGNYTDTTIDGCTDCLNATEIEDIYILKAGDTATGNYNFDSNTFVINGSSNNVGIGISNPTNRLHIVNNQNSEAVMFVEQNNGTTGEKDVFTIKDEDVGGGSQDESSTLKVWRSGSINDNDDGTSLIEITYSAANNDQDDEHFYTLGRLADEGQVRWGVDLYDADIWTEGSVKGGATGTNCGGTNAPCFNNPSFFLNSSGISYINSGDVGINDSTPTYKLDVNGTFRVTGLAQLKSGTSVNDIDTVVANSDNALITSGGVFDGLAGKQDTLGNNSITPDMVLSTGQTDEYVLTYELTGDTWEWASVAGGGDITDVFNCTTGDCNTMTVGTSEYLTYGSGYIDANRFAGVTTVDATEFGYLNGLTAAIQTGTDLTNDTVQASELTIDYGAFTCNGTTCTLDTSYQPLEATLTDIADGTIAENLINTAHPWADNEVSNTLTCSNLVAGSAVVDISTETNLTAGRSLTMSGDSVVADSELYHDEKCIYFEDPVATDDFKSLFHFRKAATITGLWGESDQTVNCMLQIDDGTPADIDSVDLVCDSTPADDTSLNGDTSAGAGDRLDLVITSVSGTPTWVSICVDFTYND